MKSIAALIKQNLILEYRNWAQGAGLLVLVWIISYIIYRVNPNMAAGDFHFIFWIFLLLISVNIVLRQESHYSEEERLALYTLVHPVSLIIARILFNFLYLEVVAILFYLFLFLYFSHVVELTFTFLLILTVGCMVISTAISLVSAIGVYARGQNTLVSILALPLLVPVILILSALGKNIEIGAQVDMNNYLVLSGIGIIGLSLSLILFPIIWKQ